MTDTTFTDDSGDVRFSGKIRMGGTAGQVATVQANGTLAPAAGGGSQSLLSFPIAFNDAGLSNGIVLWTPTVDMWMRDAWFHVTTGWDGTNPLADMGVIADGKGVFAAASGLTPNGVPATNTWPAVGLAPSFATSPASGTQVLSAVTDPYNGNNPLPYLVVAGTQVAVWVSQDGTPGGAAPGAAQGAASLVIDAVPVA